MTWYKLRGHHEESVNCRCN